MRAKTLKNPRYPIHLIERGLKLDDHDKTVCVSVIEDVSVALTQQL